MRFCYVIRTLSPYYYFIVKRLPLKSVLVQSLHSRELFAGWIEESKARVQEHQAREHHLPSGPEPQQGSGRRRRTVTKMSTMKSERSPPPAVFTASQRLHTNIAMHRLDISDREHLVSSVPIRPDDGFRSSEVTFSRRVPDWLWAILTAVLGIDTDRSPCRLTVAIAMRFLTVFSALVFACSGLVFKVFDVISSDTKTTMFDAIGDAILGAYWVGIGIYARKLAARLFSNTLFVECIQMHSKTIFKMNTAVIIVVLSITVVSTNLYSNRNILDWETPEVQDEDRHQEGTCVTAGVNVALCEVYFIARAVYSGFNLLWNLLVSTILLSVCRTHTICIRRFMRELLYDNKIYEEFVMLQAITSQIMSPNEENSTQRDRPKTMAAILESKGWDNSIHELGEVKDEGLPDNAGILQTMRNIRRSTYDLSNPGTASPPTAPSAAPTAPITLSPSSLPLPTTALTTPGLSNNHEDGDTRSTRHNSSVSFEPPSTNQEAPVDERTLSRQYNTILSSLGADETLFRQALEDGNPPIMSTEDLLFKFFQLVRRLSSTSRLLQRWMSSVISIVLLWCALYILYWTGNSVTWLGLLTFALPLVMLYLLTSAYAEVNFEAGRIIKCVLPTPERMDSLDHMQNQPPELKVFSFTISYNAITTVVAGVAVSFATSIILEQVMR
ncbi:hypothetical protein RRG08_013470 [Elysia crispata]|uniref:Uncharacterized protein n=1 Tax=Elysia crispata TaxID=231223 RepID=A0AAE1DPT1_9GAST|nr:hypothetical protein RRG08_013470 [Elysia crispata]